MKIVICDDMQEDLDLISTYIMKCANDLNIEIECNSYMDGNDLLNNINDESDVVFLDIDMPKPNGIDIANTLNEKFPELNIVFITNHSNLVFDVIKFRPLGFVRKNKIEDEMKQALIRVQNEIYNNSVVFQNLMVIKMNDILYMESKGHNIEIHTKEKVQTVRATMSEYEQKLKPYGFVRIHKGFIVNMKFICRINGRIVKLDNGIELISGGNYNKNVREAYAKFISKKYCV